MITITHLFLRLMYSFLTVLVGVEMDQQGVAPRMPPGLAG
jgi:hypothetical protein